MPAILRRRKLISIKPERKNAVTYRKEEVQAEVMTPPPAADQQKIPGSTVVCPACKREVNKAEVEKNKYVCYECGSYFRVRTKNRIRMVADAGTFEPWFEYLESENPLDFPEYTQKVEAAREKTGLHEAVTIGQKLPEGFQRAEFQLEHGFVDAIVERKNLKITLNRILKMHHSRKGFADFDPLRMDDNYEPTELMRERAARAKGLTPWEKVKAARKVDRPSATDYMENIFDEFMEFHGDRYFRDDPAIVGGVAYLDGQPVTVIGIQKGKDFKDCMKHNYGMPSPEGYRKAIRLMKQAEKFGRPVITFVNTAGAYCGMEAEERGQGEAIARNLYEMSALKVPVLCIMIGEGGSGGALALAVGNEVWMMENATYCVLSPEGFASILWKDGKRAKEASEIMKITAMDLKSLGVIEQIIPEYGVADAKACESISRYLKGNIKKFLEKQNGKTGEQFASERYARFRKF